MADETIDTGADEVVDEVVEETPDEGGGEALEAEGAGSTEHEEPVPDPAKVEKPKDEKPPARSYRAKINGKETDVPAEHVDALASLFGVPAEDLLRGPASMLKAGQERLRKAAEVEKRAKAIAEAAKQDPVAALRMAGLTDEEIQKQSIAYVAKLYEAEQLKAQNPDAFRAKQLEEELAKRDADEKARQTEAEEAEVRKSVEAQKAKLNDEFTSVLKSGGVPATSYAVSRMAQHLLDHAKAMEAGEEVDDLTPADVVPLVAEDLRREHAKLYGEMSGEDFAKAFPEMAEKIRKYHLGAVRRQRTPGNQPETQARPNTQQKTYSSISAVLRDL